MKYTVTFANPTDWSVEVEAENPAEAFDRANEEFDYPSLCHQCATHRNDGDWEAAFATDEAGTETPA
ncbi:hypothetical protein MUG78_16990 [Gordonia alkaliphila]|uniref:hypothetical protein n=1 Tax=Gordonia alkaliphila TaxID=1053547 RepID=UPI001FF6B8BE|nr:hypothetical protein [Gordonia alkaliphila]MCK0441098.1 hypothetical protein [Gordonia alkaliphila]